MRVAVTAEGPELDAPVSPVFGRCPCFLLVETDDFSYEARPNEAAGAPGGAGIQAAQAIVNAAVEAVITGQIGPNAFALLQATQIPVYRHAGGTARQAVEAFLRGELERLGGPSAQAHAGMSWGAAMGAGAWGGRGMGAGRGAGRGQPGRAGWMGGLRGAQAPGGAEASGSAQELAGLREEVERLRQQVDDLLKRLDQLR